MSKKKIIVKGKKNIRLHQNESKKSTSKKGNEKISEIHDENVNNEAKNIEAKTVEIIDDEVDIDEKDTTTDEQPDVEDVNEEDYVCEAEKLENELKNINDKHLRLMAEYDNYRKRTLKEKADLMKTAGEKILTGILPLIDDFERALQHIDSSSEIQAVKEGTNLIYNKFIKFLLQHGVKEIEAIGKDFDAELYDAITKIPAPNSDMKGKIIDCVEKGYMLDDKVIRYAKVVVGE